MQVSELYSCDVLCLLSAPRLRDSNVQTTFCVLMGYGVYGCRLLKAVIFTQRLFAYWALQLSQVIRVLGMFTEKLWVHLNY